MLQSIDPTLVSITAIIIALISIITLIVNSIIKKTIYTRMSNENNTIWLKINEIEQRIISIESSKKKTRKKSTEDNV